MIIFQITPFLSLPPSTGDRIAIISNGSLLCCGSFEFLRHRFGRGHQLTLVTTSQSERRTSTTSHTFTVTAEVEDTDNSPSLPSSPIPLNLTAEDNVQNISLCIQVRSEGVREEGVK